MAQNRTDLAMQETLERALRKLSCIYHVNKIMEKSTL